VTYVKATSTISKREKGPRRRFPPPNEGENESKPNGKSSKALSSGVLERKSSKHVIGPQNMVAGPCI